MNSLSLKVIRNFLVSAKCWLIYTNPFTYCWAKTKWFKEKKKIKRDFCLTSFSICTPYLGITPVQCSNAQISELHCCVDKMHNIWCFTLTSRPPSGDSLSAAMLYFNTNFNLLTLQLSSCSWIFAFVNTWGKRWQEMPSFPVTLKFSLRYSIKDF